MSLKRTRRHIILYSFILFISFFLITETVLRVLNFKYARSPLYFKFHFLNQGRMERLFNEDSDLFWVLKPGQVVKWKKPIEINSRGFRGPEFDPVKRPQECRIVCLGDSCTFIGREPYPQMIQNLVNTMNIINKIQVINAGVPGYSSYQGLILLKKRVLPLHPDVITVSYGWNDHWLSHGFSDKLRRQPDKEIIGIREIANKMKIYQFLNYIIARLQQFGDSRDTVDSSKYRVSLKDYKHNLLSMIKTCREHTIKLFLLTAPSALSAGNISHYLVDDGYCDDMEKLPELHQQYNDIVRTVGSQESIPVIDTDALFNDTGIEQLFADPYKNPIHFNERGHALLARLIINNLETKTNCINLDENHHE